MQFKISEHRKAKHLYNKERSHTEHRTTKEKENYLMVHLISSSTLSHHIESDFFSVLSFGANLVVQEIVIQLYAFNKIIRTESFPSTSNKFARTLV